MISGDMNITEVVAEYPMTMDVFVKHGMGCLGCAAAQYESIEEGALAHGVQVDELLRDLNQRINEENNRGY